jgi:hypothetical protein
MDQESRWASLSPPLGSDSSYIHGCIKHRICLSCIHVCVYEAPGMRTYVCARHVFMCTCMNNWGKKPMYKKLYDAQKTTLKLTQKQVKDWYDSIDVVQEGKTRRSGSSFVAEKPLDQFQIDLIYMTEKWHNRGYKYLFCDQPVQSRLLPIGRRLHGSAPG